MRNTSTSNNTTSANVTVQTARAIATDESGTASKNVRLLFDDGSQRSYITDSLKTNLNLEPLKQEKLNLNTFGSSGVKSQRCDEVKVW